MNGLATIALLAAALLRADPPQLTRWLECIECSNGELMAVAALGQPLVPVLRRYLADGPTLSQRAAFRSYVTRVQLVTSGDTTSASSRTQIERRVDAFDRQYRRRAALALGSIGGRSALEALNAATNTRLPPDVAAAVARALQEADR